MSLLQSGVNIHMHLGYAQENTTIGEKEAQKSVLHARLCVFSLLDHTHIAAPESPKVCTAVD